MKLTSRYYLLTRSLRVKAQSMTEIVIRTQSFRSPVSISRGDGVVECTLEFASLGERLLTFTSPLLSRWDVPSAGILSKLPMGRRQMGRPICRHFVQTADGPSADGTVSSGYILPNLKTGRQQMGRPNCQHFDQSADMPPFCRRSRLQTGQNVGRWAVPSANILPNLPTFCPICRRAVGRWDGLIWLLFAQSEDGTSADGTSPLPTFCPVCWHAIHFADDPGCRRDKMLMTGPSGYTLPNLQTERRQMGHPNC